MSGSIFVPHSAVCALRSSMVFAAPAWSPLTIWSAIFWNVAVIWAVYCALIALIWSHTSCLLEPLGLALAAAGVAGGAALDVAVDGVDDPSPQAPAKNS